MKHLLPRLSVGLLLAFFLVFRLSAQTEICNNGIDDDNDGYVDCYDLECAGSSNCSVFFYGQPTPDCQFNPANVFDIQLDWESTVNVADLNQILAGDFDNDGVVEILAGGNRGPSQLSSINEPIFILDGRDGSVETSFLFPSHWDGQGMPATGDLDNDGFAEFVIPDRTVAFTSSVFVYEHDGTLKYSTQINNGSRRDNNDWGIADFNQDGNPEIYTRGQILNGQNGNIIINGPGTQTDNFSVAADVLSDTSCLNCVGLELVIGNRVFSVDIANGNLNLEVTAATGGPGLTSLVDWDLDGDLDGIIQQQTAPVNQLYAWDLQSPDVLGIFTPPNSTSSRSQPNIGNLDSDSEPEAIQKNVNTIYAIDNDFTILWTQAIDENGTGTPATIFDFNGDGVAEVIHRDEANIEIRNGPDGTLISSIGCFSATGWEVLIVADADDDGEAEIITTCNTQRNGSSGYNINAGTVRMYESLGDPWQPTRKVWNQHSYFVTNINDDLSIPIVQQNHHLEFPGPGSGNRPLNLFMAQSSVIDTGGNPIFPAADATIEVQSVSCENDTQTSVTFEICNFGDETLPTGTPISFYDANPTTSTGNLIFTDGIPSSVTPGNCLFVDYLLPVTSGMVFAFVNDDGTLSLPFDPTTDLPVTGIGECDFENNIDSLYISCRCDSLGLMAGFDSITDGLYFTRITIQSVKTVSNVQ